MFKHVILRETAPLPKKESKGHSQLVSKKRDILLFLFMIFVSVYLRFPGINYGLPYVFSPQEGSNLLTVVSLFKNPLGIGSYELPSLFIYLNALVVFFFTGSFNMDTLLNNLELKSGSFYLSLRLISVIFAAGSIVLLYKIGKVFSNLVALLAGGFLAVAFLHVKFSSVFSNVTFIVFFVLLTTYCVIKVLDGNKNYFRLSVISAFLGSCFSYIGLISFIPVFILSTVKKFKIKRNILIQVIGAYLLLNPRLVFNLTHLVSAFQRSFFESYTTCSLSASILHSVLLLSCGVGPVIWVGSLLFILSKKDMYDLIILKIVFSVPLIYIGILSVLHLANISYSVLLVPYYCLGSALFFNSFYSSIPLKSESSISKRFFFIVFILFAFYIPLKYALKYNKISSILDTRAIATEWISENASGNVRIAWDKNSVQPNWFNAYDKKKLKWLFNNPETFIDRREFEVTSVLLKRDNLLNYLRKKVDYIITNSYDEEKILRSKKHGLYKAYYTKLLELKPAVVFNPYLREYEKKIHYSLLEDLYSPYLSLWHRERSGPVIKVYKI